MIIIFTTVILYTISECSITDRALYLYKFSTISYFRISLLYYKATSTGVYSYPKSSATALKVTFPLATFTPGTNSGNLATASLTPNLAITLTYLAVALHNA